MGRVFRGLREFSRWLPRATIGQGVAWPMRTLAQSGKPSDSDGCDLLEAVSYREFPSDSDGFERELARIGKPRGKGIGF